MRGLLVFFHLAAAVFWMGGMAFMLFALRPALPLLEPPQRAPLVAAVLQRFLTGVAVAIGVLLVTGAALFARAAAPPPGWLAMAALGVVMMLLFAHLWFAPWTRLRRAVQAQDWPAAGAAAAQVALLAKVNLALGTVAIAAVLLWH